MAFDVIIGRNESDKRDGHIKGFSKIMTESKVLNDLRDFDKFRNKNGNCSHVPYFEDILPRVIRR